MRPTLHAPLPSAPSSPALGACRIACALLVALASACDDDGEVCGTAPATASCPTAASRSACVQAGGCWGVHGWSPEPGCICPTTDAGEACTSWDECEGDCLHHEEDASGACLQLAEGTCSEWNVTFGCYCSLDGPGAWSMICVD